jgi:hypothetical protein
MPRAASQFRILCEGRTGAVQTPMRKGGHPSKRVKLLVGGKCTADSRHPDPLSRGDEGGMSR